MAATRTRKTKSAETCDREVAQQRNLLAENAELRKLLAESDARCDRLLEDNRRKEKLLSIYQRKQKQGATTGAGTPKARLFAIAEKLGVPVSALRYQGGVVYHGADQVG